MLKTGFFPAFDGGQKNGGIRTSWRIRPRDLQQIDQFIPIVQADIGHEHITSRAAEERLTVVGIFRQHLHQPAAECHAPVRPLPDGIWTVPSLSREHPRTIADRIGPPVEMPHAGKRRHCSSGVTIRPSARNSSSRSTTWRSQLLGSTLYSVSSAAQMSPIRIGAASKLQIREPTRFKP